MGHLVGFMVAIIQNVKLNIYSFWFLNTKKSISKYIKMKQYIIIFFSGFLFVPLFVYLFAYIVVYGGYDEYMQINNLRNQELKNLSYQSYLDNKLHSIPTKDTILLIYTDFLFEKEKENVIFLIEECKKKNKKYCIITEDKIHNIDMDNTNLYYQKEVKNKVYKSYYLIANQKIYYSQPLFDKIEKKSFIKQLN